MTTTSSARQTPSHRCVRRVHCGVPRLALPRPPPTLLLLLPSLVALLLLVVLLPQPVNLPSPLPSPPRPPAQIFGRIRQHAERTKRTTFSWGDLMDFLGTSFKVRGCYTQQPCSAELRCASHPCGAASNGPTTTTALQLIVNIPPFPPPSSTCGSPSRGSPCRSLTSAPPAALSCAVLQPEQIRQCLVDYASINVWQLAGGDGEAPSIELAAA